MTKLRSIAVVAVLGAALFAPQAQAEDGGWNTQYGMIFTVENVFQNNSARELGDLNGGVGIQYNLGSQNALRLMVNLSRFSNSDYVSEETVVHPDGTSTITPAFHAPGSDTADPSDDFSSQYSVGIGADYMIRLSPAALSPYLGVGGGIGYTQTATAYRNDVNPNYIVEVDDMSRTVGLGAEGILGVEWRVHKSISLFAEYKLGLTLWQRTSFDYNTTISQPAPTGTEKTTDAGSHSEFVNWNTGLGQGGTVGLVAFF